MRRIWFSEVVVVKCLIVLSSSMPSFMTLADMLKRINVSTILVILDILILIQSYSMQFLFVVSEKLEEDPALSYVSVKFKAKLARQDFCRELENYMLCTLSLDQRIRDAWIHESAFL